MNYLTEHPHLREHRDFQKFCTDNKIDSLQTYGIMGLPKLGKFFVITLDSNHPQVSMHIKIVKKKYGNYKDFIIESEPTQTK